MNKLTKKYNVTQGCIDVIRQNIIFTLSKKSSLTSFELNNLLKRKLIKAYWIGYATGINNYKSHIKNNRNKNKYLKSIDDYLMKLENEDYKLIKGKAQTK